MFPGREHPRRSAILRLERLAESWIAPAKVRELRELVRFRAKLSMLRGGLKAQAHAVMAKNGMLPVRGGMWASPAGRNSTLSARGAL